MTPVVVSDDDRFEIPMPTGVVQGENTGPLAQQVGVLCCVQPTSEPQRLNNNNNNNIIIIILIT
jgi:hypothetical protein